MSTTQRCPTALRLLLTVAFGVSGVVLLPPGECAPRVIDYRPGGDAQTLGAVHEGDFIIVRVTGGATQPTRLSSSGNKGLFFGPSCSGGTDILIPVRRELLKVIPGSIFSIVAWRGTRRLGRVCSPKLSKLDTGSGDSAGGFAYVVRQASAAMATVPITVYAEDVSDLDKLPQKEIASEGSGVIISPEGLIVTCDHVVHGGKTFVLRYGGRLYKATKLTGDTERWAKGDIAFLEIDRSDGPVSFTSASLAAADVTREIAAAAPVEPNDPIGERPVALGYPSSRRSMLQTLSGAIEGSGNSRFASNGYTLEDWLKVRWPSTTGAAARLGQGDAVRGMSGGPLLSPDGHVIGLVHSVDGLCISSEVVGRALASLGRSAQYWPVIAGAGYEEARRQDAAWECIVVGLSYVSVGRLAEATTPLCAALRRARTEAARRTALAVLERTGAEGGQAAAALIGSLSEPAQPCLAPEIVPTLIGIAATNHALPRRLVRRALALDAPQSVAEAGMSALLTEGDASVLTPDEWNCLVSLRDDWWLAPQAIYTTEVMFSREGEAPLTAAPANGLLCNRQNVRQLLTRSLQHPDRRVHGAGIRALLDSRSPALAWQIYDDPTIDQSVKVDVRIQMINALGQIVPPDDRDSVARLAKILNDEALTDLGQRTRHAAAAALGSIGRRDCPEAVTKLAEFKATHLGKGDARLRAATVASLGVTGSKNSLAALLEALDDTDPQVQAFAADALGKGQTAVAVDRLRSMLADGSRSDLARVAAAVSLGTIGDKSAVATLLALVGAGATGEASSVLASTASLALGAIGDQSAVPKLVAALGDRGARLGSLAGRTTVVALGDIGGAEAAEALHAIADPSKGRFDASHLTGEVRRLAVRGLGTMGARGSGSARGLGAVATRDVVASLSLILSTSKSATDKALRLETIRSLAGLGDASALDTLMDTLLWTADRHIQDAAICAMQALHANKTTQRCIAALDCHRAESSFALGRAARALGVLGGTEASSALCRMVTNKAADGQAVDESVREQAALALGQLRATDAIPQLTAVLASDPSDGVLFASAVALSKIGGEEAKRALAAALAAPGSPVRTTVIAHLGRVPANARETDVAGAELFDSHDEPLLCTVLEEQRALTGAVAGLRVALGGGNGLEAARRLCCMGDDGVETVRSAAATKEYARALLSQVRRDTLRRPQTRKAISDYLWQGRAL